MNHFIANETRQHCYCFFFLQLELVREKSTFTDMALLI
jgi:hypothetical protein